MTCYCGWTHRVLFKGSPSTYALDLISSHPVTDIAAVVPAPWLRLAILPSPWNHFHQPTNVLLFLSPLIKWTKGFFWPTFPSIYCWFSLYFNFLMAICKLQCFPSHSFEYTPMRLLPALLHKICLCLGHQDTSLDHSNHQFSVHILPDQQHLRHWPLPPSLMYFLHWASTIPRSWFSSCFCSCFFSALGQPALFCL